MANQLDLEEQEQLDQIKHFWKQYGNAITWGLIVVLSIFASWNFYQYRQRSQAAQAATLFEEVERSVQSSDVEKMQRVFTEMKDRFPSTTYAQQTGLLIAKQLVQAGKLDPAKSALTWVSEKSADSGYQALAKLRLASLLTDSKEYDKALTLLVTSFPAGFDALVADRKGDVYQLQGKSAEAIVEYQKAYGLFDERTDYRRLVEVKLNALSVEVQDTASVSGK